MAQGDQATGRMNFQVPDEMRPMAERSVTQARQALESYFGGRAAHQREHGADQRQGARRNQGYGPEGLSAVETEPASFAGLCGAAGAGRGPGRDYEIQSEFARTQTEAMQAQMKEYGSVMQSAMDTAKGIAQSAVEAVKDATQTVTDTATHAKDKAAGAAADVKGKGTRK